MIKVLILSPCYTHPPLEGNRQRILSLAEGLKKTGYDVHLALLPNTKFPSGDPRQMRRYWGKRLHVQYLFTRWSPGFRLRRLIALTVSPQLRSILGIAPPGAPIPTVDELYLDWWGLRLMLLQWWHRFDVVFSEYVFVSRCLLDFPGRVRKVIDTHDIFSGRDQAMSSALNIAGSWLSPDATSEGLALDRAHIVLGIQEEEAKQLRAMTRRPVVTVGHFVQETPKCHGMEYAHTRILFVGSNNVVNVDGCAWFLECIFERVVRCAPDVTFRVVGSIGAGLSKQFPGHSRLDIAGEVETLASEYASATVVINPVRFGTGLPIKSIEALAHGAVLLCTPQGARGIRWEPTSEAPCVVAKDNDAFAEQLCTLLTDPQLRSRYRRAAVGFVAEWNRQNAANLVSVADPAVAWVTETQPIAGR